MSIKEVVYGNIGVSQTKTRIWWIQCLLRGVLWPHFKRMIIYIYVKLFLKLFHTNFFDYTYLIAKYK